MLQVFEKGQVEGWVVVDDEAEAFGGAGYDAVEVMLGGAGGVAGLQVASGVVEEAPVQNDGDLGIFQAAGVAQRGGGTMFQGQAGTGSIAGEQGPALLGEIGAGGAKVAGFVKIVHVHAIAVCMMRSAAAVEKVGNKGGKGAVGANLGGKCFGREGQVGMAPGKGGATGCAGVEVKFWRCVEGEKQGGVAG